MLRSIKFGFYNCIGCCCGICPCYTNRDSQEFLDERGNFIDVENNTELMNTRLIDTTIISSHNSFVENTQNIGISSLNAIGLCLRYGCRCIELDVFQKEANEDPKPVIAHGIERYTENNDLLTTTYLNFDETIKYISEEAFKNTSDPLIICMEMNIRGNKITCAMIVDSLMKYMRDRIVIKNDRDLENTLLRDLINKVIIIPKSGSYCIALKEISYNNLKNNSSNDNPLNLHRRDGLKRIYPAGDRTTIFSYNKDLIKFLENGANICAMNFQIFDDHLENYLKYFGNSRFKKI